MSPPVESVIAGSRGFALALLAPLTERIGMRPRIAADPGRARAFCGEAGGLMVVEFLGGDTLQAIRDLVSQAKGIRVVAAVPEKHASADAPLRALGVDVARWDGTAASVVAAVGRQLASVAQASPPAGGSATAPPPRAPVAPTPQASTAAPARATPRPPAAASVPARAPAPAPTSAGPPPPAREASPARPATPSPRQAASVPAVAEARTSVPATASAPSVEVRAFEERSPLPAPAVPAGGQRRIPGAPAAVEPAWPATIPSQADAAEALERSVAGLPPAAAVVSEVIAALSDLERVVLAGGEVPVDPEPIRQAAVMRVRVAAALATVPPAGGVVDGEAVSALLAEIDALLSQVSTLAASAPPELAPALEVVRNALVREAIVFSEAAQRVSAAAPGAEAVAPHAPARRIQARLVPVERAPEKVRRHNVAVWAALAVAIALAGGYHAWNQHQRQTVRATLTTGLPAGLTQIPGPPGGPRVLVRATTTEVPDPAEVAKLKAAEEARGNVFRESDGMIFIERAPREPQPPVPSTAP